MRQKGPKRGFWAILGTINIIVLTLTVTSYVRAESGDAHVFAGIVLVAAVFLLVILDVLSAIIAYLGDAY